MVDPGWDNGGGGSPVRSGMPAWMKVTLGCGVAALILLCTCVGGTLYLRHRIRQDPQGFKRQIKSMVQKKIQPDWAFLRRAVDRIQTDEGAKALYAANPKLSDQYSSEARFLEAVRGWRPELQPIPEALPEMESDDLRYNQGIGGGQLSYRFPNGKHIHLAWDGPRSSSNPDSHQLTEFTVR